ncbi:MAG: aldo/keto reductase [Gemmatimonadota bacterium]|nr:aldo/keto reductase [Gemmatimonadota bacterium]
MRRRSFAATLLSLVPGWGIRPGRSSPSTLPTRPLGRTGLDVTILGLGGSHVSLAGSEAGARRLVETALDEGINFFDTAESYGGGSSERWLGMSLAGVRKSVVLMTKTHAPAERSAESARRHLDGSLARLGTDYLDLWQLHSVKSVEDVDRAFGPGGAMEFITEARRQGTVRFIGVTGHVTPAAHRRALAYWDQGIRFDVMQMPVNPVDYHQQSFTRQVLPLLVDRGIGVIAMKTSADGALPREGLATIDECQRYVWSLPVSVAVVGMERPELVRENARRAREFRAMSEAEIATLRSRLEPRARLALEWYKR